MFKEGHKHSVETKIKIGHASSIFLRGKKLSQSHKDNISKSRLGSKNQNFGKPMSDNAKRILSEIHKGSRNHNWKGGISTENNTIRNSQEMRLWRKSVFIRDNFTCQKYKTKGGELESHHINNFADFPELRFAIDNGITFSKKAHDEFHKKYGRKNNTLEQLEEFLLDDGGTIK